MTSPIPEDSKPANAADDTTATPGGQDSGSAERGARVPRPVRRTRPGEDGGKPGKSRGPQDKRGQPRSAGRQGAARGAKPGGDNPDDVFSFVTSDAYDSAADDGHGSRAARPVRRDLTADDDAPKLHKVLGVESPVFDD